MLTAYIIFSLALILLFVPMNTFCELIKAIVFFGIILLAVVLSMCL
jgi:hypothetical protein